MTPRDSQILTTLASHVRLLSFGQIADAWWPGTNAGQRHLRRRLRELCNRQLLARLEVQARPLLPLATPVATWHPGQAPPDYGPLAWTLWKRWQTPPQRTVVYVARPQLTNRLGGVATGTLHNLAAVSHDLHVAQLYVRLLIHEPELARLWVSEDVLAPTRIGQKLPDAVLQDSSGRPRLVMEFGGAYPPERLAAFHEDCAHRRLPYEIW